MSVPLGPESGPHSKTKQGSSLQPLPTYPHEIWLASDKVPQAPYSEVDWEGEIRVKHLEGYSNI